MSEPSDDRGSILETGVTYRLAYGCVRNRLDRAFDSKWIDNSAEPAIRAELAAGELHLEPWVLGRRRRASQSEAEAVDAEAAKQ
jgi:hypothetical protein